MCLKYTHVAVHSSAVFRVALEQVLEGIGVNGAHSSFFF